MMDNRGQALAEIGMFRALTHANLTHLSWGDRAYKIAFEVAMKGKPFTVEDVRIRAALVGLPDPPDARAYGTVMRLMVQDKRIRKTGRYVNATSPKCHCRPLAEWIVV